MKDFFQMSSFVALVSLVLYMSVLFLKSWFYKADFLLLEISRNEDKMSIYKEPLNQNSSLTPLWDNTWKL